MDVYADGQDDVRHLHRLFGGANPAHDHDRVVVSLLTGPIVGYLLIRKLTGQPLLGWTSVMLGVTVFSGLQFLMMGVVGEYLYRIYAEVVRRPLYFISATTDTGARR